MELTHLKAFMEAMARKDIEAMLPHMADEIVLRSPVAIDPFHGKEAARTVLSGLFAGAEGFDFREVMSGFDHAAAFFTVSVAGNVLDGMQYWRLNEGGLITEMTAFWRPVSLAVEAQRALASGSTQWH